MTTAMAIHIVEPEEQERFIRNATYATVALGVVAIIITLVVAVYLIRTIAVGFSCNIMKLFLIFHSADIICHLRHPIDYTG